MENEPEHAEAEKIMAEKSIVLLKNDNQILPLTKNIRVKQSLYRAFIKAIKRNKGFWDVSGLDDSRIIYRNGWE